MDTSLPRHSPTFENKSFFSNPSYSESDEHSDDGAPVRLHPRQAPAVTKPAVPASGHYTPLGKYTVSVPASCAARSRSMSLSCPAQEHPASPPSKRRASIDTQHVTAVVASGRETSPAVPETGSAPASPTQRRVSDAVARLVSMARDGANAQALCKAFDRDVLRPLLRAKPLAGPGALAPEVLMHVLDRLAAAYPALARHQPGAGLFDALAGTLFKRLGGHRMREADSQGVFGFLAALGQGPHAGHRVGLIVRTLGQMRHALGEHHMSHSQLDAFTLAMCQARHQWPHDSDDRFALFAKVHLGGLLGPVKDRAPRAASVVDSLVRAARRLERPADLVPLAQGLTGAVMEGVGDASGWRAAVRHASSLWLSSLVERGEVASLTAVCRGVAMQTREANTRAALFGQLDAMAGLAAHAGADQMDAMAAGIASCRPGVGMLRQWLVECCDQASGRGKPELRLAAQCVFEAIARKAKLDVTAHEEQLAPTVARAPDPAAVNALMRDMIARAQAGASPQELAGRFAIEVARYKTPDATGAIRLQRAGFEAIASRLFAASGVLLGGDPGAPPFASPLSALLRALVDAGGGAALGQPELDAVFQQAARLKAKGIVHAQAAESCVHEALFGALRRGAPERPTQAQAVEWSAQVRRFFLAARRPADEDGQLVSAAQALARHSAGLSPAALAFMSAGLVRGVTDLAAHAPQPTRDIVHRNVTDALSQLTIAVAGQTQGRSRLAFVGLGAATAFNDEQRKSSQHVLLGAIPYKDPNVREGLDGWMYALAGRVCREAFAQWVETAQASAGPDRGYFSLYAQLARYAEDVDKPVASAHLFSAIDQESGMSFTQAFAAVQARLRLPAGLRLVQAPVPTAPMAVT